jgi:3-oxoacyl-(acyl-carrier-protein) synthase/NAD(P)-dependent dehydrogenase (short-subunit alcohol dehydrogenase family)
LAERSPGFRVAIIGMACRFPEADTCEQFWRNLVEGRESIRRYSREELLEQHAPRDLVDDPAFVPAAPLLAHIDGFDAGLFGVTPKEAAILDPQHRLFLECAWESLERAGYDPVHHARPIGFFAGTGVTAYAFDNLRDEYRGPGGFEAMLANDKDFLVSRVAYKLNLRGPAIAVQTACSTSLVAVHLACQSLLAGECDMALAGGVSVRLPHIGGYLYQAGMIASPDGHCRAFDSAAAGTVPGSGAGIAVLKRLDDAVADRDNILAVIRGSAVNNDGMLKAGFTAPSAEGQAAVVREAVAVAGIEPDDITYVEAHGTGTPLGDPIEVQALNEVFRPVRQGRGRCALGSVKTNIGHTDTAAGIAGLIKTVLALRHRELPPSLHFVEPNPEIRFADGPFEVVRERRHWHGAEPRRAGISSFGIGGTNAHVVVEEWPRAPEPRDTSGARLVIPLSARSKDALESIRIGLADWLDTHPEIPVSSLALTLSTGRRPLNWRTFIVAGSGREAARMLRHDPAAVVETEPGDRPLAFLFSGEGAYPGMARSLMAERVFRDRFVMLAEICREETGEDLHELLVEAAQDAEGARERLRQTRIAQPALFVVQESLARLLISWGVHPGAMLGHGVGEWTAAAMAGIFDPEDAMRLVCRHPVLAEFAREVARFPRRAPRIPVISNVTGSPLTADQAMAPEHWAQPHTVRFEDGEDGIATLKSEARRILLEIGPGDAASSSAGNGAISTMPAAREASGGGHLARALGLLWRSGVSVDWNGYHSGRGGVRVELPTYPFERSRYWIAPPASGRLGERRPIDGWFYLPAWKPAASGTREEIFGRYLLLGPDSPFRSELARILTHRGATVQCETDPVQWAHLVESPETDGPAHCLVLTPLAAGSGQSALSLCYHLPARLLRALAPMRDRVRVTIVSGGMQPVLGPGCEFPVASTLLGPVIAARQELPDLRVNSIDLSAHAEPGELAAALESGCPDHMLAWRSGRAWVPSYQPIGIPGPSPLRTNLVCVITGGLGGVGLALAERLARSARARVALLTRSPFPDRSLWTDLEQDPAHGSRIRRLRQVEAAGGEVMVLRADAADAAQLRDGIRAVRARFGPIHGAIHAAGIAGGGLLAVRSEADADLVLQPKVLGSMNLASALEPDTLDFLVFCSSLTTAVGGFGQSDYIAANVFLDRFARHLHAKGVPAVSIAWDTWSQSGMAVSASAPAELRRLWELAGTVASGIRDEEGGTVLERVLGSSWPCVVVSTSPLEPRLTSTPRVIAESLREIERLRKDAPVYPRPAHLPPVQEPASELERRICAMFSENLGFEGLGAEDDYFECGGDSLTAVSLVNLLQAVLGEPVHVTAVFEAPSPRRLAVYLDKHYGQTLARWLTGIEASVEPQERTLTSADITGFRQMLPVLPARTGPLPRKNRRAVFLLSPPRTGSTLLRAMLAGHPRLFAPPELALLSYHTFGERAASMPDQTGLLDGPLQALRTAMGCDGETARTAMARFESSVPVMDFYAHLQSLIGDRLLVDKTPHYVLDAAVLRRAEEDFEDPLYLMLQRHPYGMIRSYVESRIDLLLPERLREGSRLTRRQLGELIWLQGYGNLREFSPTVPPHRQCWLRFEDMVADPGVAMNQVCTFLGLEFDPRMQEPYLDRDERMTGGMRAGSRMLGDVKFHGYSGVDLAVADRWRDQYKTDFLCDESAELAHSLGYRLIADRQSPEDLPPVDEMSDDEVRVELARHGHT